MKRLFTLLIAILYLGVSSGIALQVHYCMDKVAAFTLMPAASDKCDTCGMKGNSCCRDEVTFFKLQDKFMKGGIRPTEEMELAGMDLPEMGMLAYPEFMGSHAPGLEELQVADPQGTELNV